MPPTVAAPAIIAVRQGAAAPMARRAGRWSSRRVAWSLATSITGEAIGMAAAIISTAIATIMAGVIADRTSLPDIEREGRRSQDRRPFHIVSLNADQSALPALPASSTTYCQATRPD